MRERERTNKTPAFTVQPEIRQVNLTTETKQRQHRAELVESDGGTTRVRLEDLLNRQDPESETCEQQEPRDGGFTQDDIVTSLHHA